MTLVSNVLMLLDSLGITINFTIAPRGATLLSRIIIAMVNLLNVTIIMIVPTCFLNFLHVSWTYFLSS